MGPMAQDFYAAFGLGEDDKHIWLVLIVNGILLSMVFRRQLKGRVPSENRSEN